MDPTGKPVGEVCGGTLPVSCLTQFTGPHPPSYTEVRAVPSTSDDIPWTSPPLPRIETIPRDASDLEDLGHLALIAYAQELRLEASGLRAALHAACAALAGLHVSAVRLKATRLRSSEEASPPRTVVMARDVTT